MAVALSTDHKPDDPLEQARIEAAGGFVRAGRCCSNLNLSRAIGDLTYKSVAGVARTAQPICPEPEITMTPITRSDEFLLLGCDGIFEVLSNEQIVRFVRERMPALPTATSSAEAALPAAAAQQQSGGAGTSDGAPRGWPAAGRPVHVTSDSGPTVHMTSDGRLRVSKRGALVYSPARAAS
jgi:serine/threonine protein phosphatase PrpC